MRTEITKTLLDSWLYTFNAGEDQQEQAWEDFLSTLRRERKPPNEDMQKGLDFENQVWAAAKQYALGANYHEEWKTGAERIAAIVRGGQWQIPVNADITVSGHDFWLNGRIDVLKAGVIYDIKFKTKSFSSLDLAGCYLHAPQHSIYLYCVPEAFRFDYLVSDGDALYTESYTRKTAVPVTRYLQDWLNWLETEPELKQLYEERWAKV